VKQQLDLEVCMRKVSLAALVAVSALATLAPSLSHAQLSVGARVGYMHGFGGVDSDEDLDDFAGSQLPLQLDVGYRFGQVTLGGYFSYGIAFVSGIIGDACDAAGADCSARGLRVGAQVLLDLRPKEQVDPWVGLGIGYERLSLDVAGVDSSLSGAEFLILQGGVDFHASPKFKLGPYASFSFGQYSHFDSPSVDGEIPDKTIHEFLTVGLRGQFDL
jgi:hypothetical protein